MFCPQCGKEIPEGQKFCGNCGAPVGVPSPAAIEATEPQQVQVVAPAAQAPARSVPGVSIALAVLSGVAILGTFLPWGQIFWVTVSGVESDGIFTLIGGAIGLIAGLHGIIARQVRMGAAILALLGSLLALGFAISLVVRITSVEDASIGTGLYLSLMASVGMLIASIVALGRTPKKAQTR